MGKSKTQNKLNKITIDMDDNGFTRSVSIDGQKLTGLLGLSFEINAEIKTPVVTLIMMSQIELPNGISTDSIKIIRPRLAN